MSATAQRVRSAPLLQRVVFKTDRLGEFVGRRELTAQIGHPPAEWPSVLLKEALDNSLDACEEAIAPPEIAIDVSTDPGSITISDNGPGIASDTVRNILDYTSRTSSREAYVSPTRGAQGNALKTIIAMPPSLNSGVGTSIIESRGVRHEITFRVDQLRQRPIIDNQQTTSFLSKGTRLRVDLACSLDDAEAEFLQIADDFAWVNPHLRLRVVWDGFERIDRQPSDPHWRKWRACDPTSAHWYDQPRLTRYIAAHVARDQDQRRDRTVREFIAEIRGFAGSAKQKQVLDQTGLTRAPLSSLFGPDGSPNSDHIADLLHALKTFSKPVKPLDLGLIGKEHLRACFDAVGLEAETFKYRKDAGEDDDGLPFVVETAFGWCPALEQRRIVVGVNWSVALGNPFRSFGHTGEGLEAALADKRAGRNEPIVFVLHFACPRTQYTDRGKSAIVLPGGR
jgi:hypothetical protein